MIFLNVNLIRKGQQRGKRIYIRGGKHKTHNKIGDLTHHINVPVCVWLCSAMSDSLQLFGVGFASKLASMAVASGPHWLLARDTCSSSHGAASEGEGEVRSPSWSVTRPAPAVSSLSLDAVHTPVEGVTGGCGLSSLLLLTFKSSL